MTGDTGQFGAYLIAWSQTEIDGRQGAPADAVSKGAYWRWHGDAVEVTDAIEIRNFAVLGDPQSPEVLDHCLADAAGHLVRRALGADEAQRSAAPKIGPFNLTDGIRNWTAIPVAVAGAAQPLLAFAPTMPPVRKPLRVTDVNPVVIADGVLPSDTMVCFTPGTWIDTPGGARQIDFLSAGDKVMTLDAGPQEIVWLGSRQLGLGELHRHPDIAPVRIREGALGRAEGAGDLLVSPDHRLLIRGDHIGGQGQESEVLVAARDLVDGNGVVWESRTRPVTYVHLLLETHHVIVANGTECESFHPGQAALHDLGEIDRSRLFDVMPDLATRPGQYGGTARPVLSRAEVALLSAA